MTTIGYCVLVVAVVIIGFVVSFLIVYDSKSVAQAVRGVFITVLIVGILIGGGYLYYINTVDEAIALKDILMTSEIAE